MKQKEWAIQEPNYHILQDVTLTFMSNRQVFLMVSKERNTFYFEAHSRIKLIVKRETKDEAEAGKLLSMVEYRVKQYRFLDDAVMFIHQCLEFDSILHCQFALQVRDHIIKYESLNVIIQQYGCAIKVVFNEENRGVSIYLFFPGPELHFGLFRGKFLQQDWVFFFAEAEQSNLITRK
jgi:hypothetical protein